MNDIKQRIRKGLRSCYIFYNMDSEKQDNLIDNIIKSKEKTQLHSYIYNLKIVSLRIT